MRDRNLLWILVGTVTAAAAAVTTVTWMHEDPKPSTTSALAASGNPTGDPDDPLAVAPARDATDSTQPAGSATDTGSTDPTGAAAPAFDVAPLLQPSGKYLGVLLDGAPASIAPLTAFGSAVGRAPGMVEYDVRFGDRFDPTPLRNAVRAGALPVIRWEPKSVSMTAIGTGTYDTAVEDYARQVRALNLPVAISFAPAMNGNWYPWGTAKTTATEYVAAWRRVHEAFRRAGATNVIWIWAPHAADAAASAKLEPLYPGDEYVDWVGVGGSFTGTGKKTFSGLFGPTMSEIAGFTRKPLLLLETGAQSGAAEPGEIADLERSVAANPSVVGMVWSEQGKGTGQGITADPHGLVAFRKLAEDRVFSAGSKPHVAPV